MEMVTTVLDNGKLIKPTILTDEDKDNNGIKDIGEFYQVKKDNISGKVSVSQKPENWPNELVPVRKSEKKSFILNGLDTRTLCTIVEANKIADKKIDEFAKKLTENQVVDTFKELVDYAAKHQGETLNIFSTLDEHAELIAEETKNRIDEDNKLHDELNEEITTRTSEVARLDKRVDDTNKALDEEITTRTAEVVRLDKRVDDEADTRKNADDELTANINQEITTRTAEVVRLDKRVDDEADTRKNADDELTANINQEITTRTAEVVRLDKRVDDEADTRKNADDELTANINQEITDREKAVADEADARIKADKVLTINLNKEISNREKEDAAEKTARIAADEELKAAIAEEKTERIAAIEAEADARTEADNKLNSKIDTEIDNRKKAVADETAARKAADGEITANLNQEIADRIEAVEEEETARMASDEALQDNIEQEIADRIEAVDNEATARKEADLALEEKISDEATARKEAVSEETEARKEADLALEEKISDEAIARKEADSEETEARIVEDEKLLNKFDNYYTSEETDEAIDTAIENYKHSKFKTIELTPDEISYAWKAGIKLGELKDGNKNLLLFKKSDTTDKMSFIGGEILIEIDDGEHIDYHNISLTSTGVSSYDGSSDGLLDTSLFQCRYKNEKYYGISIPELEYREDSTYTTVNMDRQVGFRIVGTQNFQWQLGLDSGISSEDIYTSIGKRAWAYSNWGYLTVKQFCNFLHIPSVAAKDSCLGKYYDGYIFFYIKMDTTRSQGGIRDVRLAPAVEYESYVGSNGETYYNIANSVSMLEEPYASIFNWNKNYVDVGIDVNNINKGTLEDSAGWYSYAASSLCRYQEIITYEILGERKQKEITNAKFFFNGWFKEDENLKPPAEYSDSDIYDVVYLNDEDTAGTVIKNAAGEMVTTDDLPQEEQEILESPYKTLEIKTASGNIITASVINSSNTFTDLCETIGLQDVVTEGQAFLAGINFHLLPLKNKMIITENSLIYILSSLNATFGAFNCQGGIYKLITKDGRNYLKMIATTNKETIAHDELNYFTGANPALKIKNVKETLLNPSNNFYYVGVLGGYRADMLGNNYWINGIGNKAPASSYHHEFTNFNYYQYNLNDDDLQEIECNSVNAQVNYVRIVSGE